MNTIKVSVAVILNDNSDLLVVRKKGAIFFTLPGGKIEKHESKAEALLRELNEELGLIQKEEDFIYLGDHQTKAANEAARVVNGSVFLLKPKLTISSVQKFSEIEELIWINKSNWSTIDLANLLKELVLPKWLKGNIN